MHQDINAIIKNIVDEAVADLKESIRGPLKNEKLKGIKAMYKRGLFLVKGGVDYAARSLGVSLFTIYNYLKELQYRQ